MPERLLLTYHWAEGSDECPHCGQRYAYELEARCMHCDDPMCPVCMLRVRGQTRCPRCIAAEAA